mmetsp:Transcript_35156/g.110669  ORF Transcript_35156/g.110669 Transcript_35156/m.110669 type:complete len:121 (+) Transcript_35156:1562-1924(+)
MPINMSRRSLAGLQHYALKDTGDERGMAPYLCAEKTDGVRYLLVVTAQREAVLMDRKMRAFEPPGGVAAVGGCFAPGTVVDGELVLCRMLQVSPPTLNLKTLNPRPRPTPNPKPKPEPKP